MEPCYTNVIQLHFVSLKRVGSQSEASQLQILFWCERTIMTRSHQIICSRPSDRTVVKFGVALVASNSLQTVRSDSRGQIILK